MTDKIKELLQKNKELVLYVVFGVLTTLVNFAAFRVFTGLLGEELYLVNNGIAWVVGVIFAFVTNKRFVFESRRSSASLVFKELTEFVGARLFSFGVEEGGMYLFVSVLGLGAKSLDVLGINISGQMIAKLILAVVVVILNYFFSKFIIFKKSK